MEMDMKVSFKTMTGCKLTEDVMERNKELRGTVDKHGWENVEKTETWYSGEKDKWNVLNK